MMAKIIRKLYGSVVIAANLRGQQSIPFLPRERLETMRDRRIRNIVAYAARTVPYYREMFAREGIDPRRIRSAADLDRLPVLNKEMVREHPRRFIADAPAARNSLSFFLPAVPPEPRSRFITTVTPCSLIFPSESASGTR